ncbi:MAG TPA: tyrosine-type recombinase/integrase [Pyrinomonadaceae bacterium]|nr:tyrosine-type recombinase/integrase [Pyrinomonadaceae bacterium]
MNLIKLNSSIVKDLKDDKTINDLIEKTSISFEIANSIVGFADSTTKRNLKRAADIRRDKIFACKSFFTLINKEPDAVKVSDINNWHQWMLDEGNQKNAEGLENSTIYTRLSHLSAYFEWLRKVPEFAHFIKSNPVRLALPKPPKKYNSPKSKALTDEDLSRLWNYLEELANDDKNKVAIRDYAIFRIFMATGMRREEVIDLSAGDVVLEDERLLLHALFKGGDYEWRTITDREVIEAFNRYLIVTKRKSSLGDKSRALWIRFDNGANFAHFDYKRKLKEYEESPDRKKLKKPNEPRMSSDGFEKQIKKYAHEAGIGHFHIHQFRHTFARIVAEDHGLLETQEALGHSNIETTREYVNRIKFKKDKYSQNINQRRKRDFSDDEENN